MAEPQRRKSVAQRMAPTRMSAAPSLDINGLPEDDRRYSMVFVEDKVKTEASNLTLRQSIVPVAMVTVLFFMWGFAYGLLDVLNKHFQQTLNITRTESSGLQGAYFGYVRFSPILLHCPNVFIVPTSLPHLLSPVTFSADGDTRLPSWQVSLSMESVLYFTGRQV